MLDIIKKIKDEKPFYEKGVVKNIFSWQELETLVNLRPFVSSKRFNFISKEYHMWKNEAWLSDNNSWPATKLEEVINKNVCYFSDCSRVNEKINGICKTIEDELNLPTDAHIYFSMKEEDKSEGFKSHWDYSHNLIAQVEGSSIFKIWSDKHTEGDQNQKPTTDPILEVTMQPGDLIFIPKNTLHEATSLSKRLSISFPIAEHLDLPPQDRKWIRI